ncbi:MAG TPA: AN1-type zinc finger domain-containing protein [Candidatus Nitrosotenuis sp.]|nr:AN1-type zinc finger domain-containing protein [Candidatus Nitrosotenuis sp.]
MKIVDCAYCGNKTDLPFECNYCKDQFCSEHRLPEEHRCVKLTSIRAKRFGEKKVIRGQKGGFLGKVFGRFKDQ